jgi:anaerobic glycerol-3-phosphate dehydrogenase
VPTLEGVTLENAVAAGAIVSGMPVLAQTSGSALTTTAPATIATPTTVATIPFVALT